MGDWMESYRSPSTAGDRRSSVCLQQQEMRLVSALMSMRSDHVSCRAGSPGVQLNRGLVNLDS